MPGDLISRGSNEKAWAPLENFLNSLNRIKTKVYVVPGNHEYIARSSAGVKMFKGHFREEWLYGYMVNIDSIAIVMLNSNFNKLGDEELSKQLVWYKAEMDSLDKDPGIKAIIVCTHHAPYSNSKVVGSSEQVQDLIVPIFEKSKKSKLFISGHSHNLEYFADTAGKHFLVIGGGGGITQPLIPVNKRVYNDLLNQDEKPLYFYLVVEKQTNCLRLIAKGFKKDFRFFEFEIGTVMLK
jgi:predicted MPP superfamily phosphohydrolase